MKKKIESLLQDARLAGNSLYERLNMGYQSARSTLEKAKAEKLKTKTAYKNASQEDSRKNRETLLALRTAFKQAKYMQRYHRAALELAEYRLSSWLENWAGQQSADTPNAAKEAAPKNKKATPEAKKTTPEAKKRTPKRPAKTAAQS
jgi:aspartate oxidase